MDNWDGRRKRAQEQLRDEKQATYADDQLTWEIHDEKGNPRSLENAHTSRDVAANAVIFPEYTSSINKIVKNNAAPVLPVFEKRLRYGKSASRIDSSGPMQYRIVMTITNAMAEFMTYDQNIACGTMIEASWTSSAVQHKSQWISAIRFTSK